MSRSQRKTKSTARRRRPTMGALVERVVQQIGSPERLVELYYWSREPELLDAIRTIVAMPPASQAALGTFLAMAGDPQSIAAAMDRKGALTLTSPHIAQALAEVDDVEKRIQIVPDLVQRIH